MIPKVDNTITCPICKRLTPEKYQEKHHLVPRAKKGKETERVCINCGDMVHKTFTNNELRDVYNTIEAIKAHPAIQKWIKWIRKKPDSFSVCMKSKKRKK